MGWTLTGFTIVVLGSAIVAIVVGLAAFRHRPDPLAWPLAVMMVAVAAWAIPHAISFGHDSVEWVAFWHRMRYPGTVTAPVIYLVLALKYAGYERWLSPRVYAGLAVVPVVTVVVAWSNPFHGLLWQSLSVARISRASILVPTYGPWYWVNLAYLYLVTLVGLLAFASTVVRSGSVYRKQAVLMFVGGAVPLVVNGVVNFGDAFDPTVDPTTIALSVSGVLFAVTLYYLDLLKIRPVARDQLIAELDDGIVVVGPDGRIRDFNPTAARVLGSVRIEQPADEVLPSNVTADGGELVAEADGEERLFRARSTTLTDDRGGDIGRIVYLSDVTEIVRREQRISVLNRVLRHNIRNELNVISGRLELMAERATTDERAHVETARQSARRIVNFAEKARHIERTLRESDAAVIAPAATVARRAVSDARETHPEASIEFERAGDSGTEVPARIVDETLFEIALAELLENAVVHSDRDAPRVTVRVTSNSNRIRVRIADDGPGIPESETAALSSRVETSLQHSSGLGLWLVKWFVSLSEGELAFEENDPRGSVVTITLPAENG